MSIDAEQISSLSPEEDYKKLVENTPLCVEGDKSVDDFKSYLDTKLQSIENLLGTHNFYLGRESQIRQGDNSFSGTKKFIDGWTKSIGSDRSIEGISAYEKLSPQIRNEILAVYNSEVMSTLSIVEQFLSENAHKLNSKMLFVVDQLLCVKSDRKVPTDIELRPVLERLGFKTTMYEPPKDSVEFINFKNMLTGFVEIGPMGFDKFVEENFADCQNNHGETLKRCNDLLLKRVDAQILLVKTLRESKIERGGNKVTRYMDNVSFNTSEWFKNPHPMTSLDRIRLMIDAQKIANINSSLSANKNFESGMRSIKLGLARYNTPVATAERRIQIYHPNVTHGSTDWYEAILKEQKIVNAERNIIDVALLSVLLNYPFYYGKEKNFKSKLVAATTDREREKLQSEHDNYLKLFKETDSVVVNKIAERIKTVGGVDAGLATTRAKTLVKEFTTPFGSNKFNKPVPATRAVKQTTENKEVDTTWIHKENRRDELIGKYINIFKDLGKEITLENINEYLRSFGEKEVTQDSLDQYLGNVTTIVPSAEQKPKKRANTVKVDDEVIRKKYGSGYEGSPLSPKTRDVLNKYTTTIAPDSEQNQG